MEAVREIQQINGCLYEFLTLRINNVYIRYMLPVQQISDISLSKLSNSFFHQEEIRQ